MELRRKEHWTTGETALQRFKTTFLRQTDKLREFKITLNNRFQALQDLPKEVTGEGSKKDQLQSIRRIQAATRIIVNRPPPKPSTILKK
ncbi:unnamed protein product [Schistosoma margrebowiei]|uniref:Uncharacterized protein n=1 Tax=Schistosoma margrebowiei TaxID=48269 RepID=A0A183MQD3_9TREM|nr:unnamed protein product [Schistosoma margrebowiei]